MAKRKLEKRIKKRIKRLLQQIKWSVIKKAEEVVKLLQLRGPSWTGRYSNSWQIQVGTEKRTG